MAKSVEFVIMLRMVCLNLFPSLICFNKNADRGWKGGCTIVHSFCIGSILGLNCLLGGMAGGGVP